MGITEMEAIIPVGYAASQPAPIHFRTTVRVCVQKSAVALPVNTSDRIGHVASLIRVSAAILPLALALPPSDPRRIMLHAKSMACWRSLTEQPEGGGG